MGLSRCIRLGLFTWALAASLGRPAAAQPAPVMVTDLTPGPSGSTLLPMVGANGRLVFGGCVGYSDGTAAGTARIPGCAVAIDGSVDSKPTTLNGVVVFEDPYTRNPARSDGTPQGTYALGTPFPTGSWDPILFSRAGQFVYFAGRPGFGTRPQLWRTDGTPEGTALVKTFSTAEGDPVRLDADGVRLFIETQVSNGTAIIWASDGTGGGTAQVGVFIDGILNGFYRTAPFGAFLAINDTLYFSMHTSSTGMELWKSNGTSQGTVLVRDLEVGGSSWPFFFVNFNGRLAFVAGVNGFSRQLVSDGTFAGTVVVHPDLQPDPAFTAFTVGTRLVVSGTIPGATARLFATDGTPGGTSAIGPNPIGPFGRPVTVGGIGYFSSADSSAGFELWQTDGTSSGTRLTADIWPGIGHGINSDALLTEVGGALFFQADNGVDGPELWRIGLPTPAPIPRSVNDTYTVASGATLAVPAAGVLANDSSNGGGTLSAQVVVGPSSGTLSLNPDGSFSYSAGGQGTHTFTYRATNAQGSGAPARVTINVTPGAVPATVSDTYSTSQNSTLNVPAPGVLANDSGALTAALVSTVTSGTLSLNANGSFAYTPPSGFNGVATFTYRAVNANGPGNVATVTITVQSGPLPTAVSDSFSVERDRTLTIAAPGLLLNDNPNGAGALTASLVSPPANGGVNISGGGGFIYTPNTGFTGTDAFSYRATAANGNSSVATATITVTAPTATAQPPTNLLARLISGNTVTITWTPPTTGPAPTSYMMEGGVAPGQVLATIPTGSTAPVFTFGAPNGAFYLRVKTVAGGQTSAASNEIRVFVNQPVAPSAPTGLAGLVNGQQVALSWRNTFGGGSPSGVILDVSGTLSASLPLGFTDSFTFNGVPGGTYTFSVRALNGSGSSPSSNPVTLAFPSVCSGAPTPPQNFLTYNVGNTLQLRWDPAASGPATTGFVLNVSGAFTGTFPLPTRGLSAAVPPGAYTFTLSAVNPCGASAPTAAQTVVVP